VLGGEEGKAERAALGSGRAEREGESRARGGGAEREGRGEKKKMEKKKMGKRKEKEKGGERKREKGREGEICGDPAGGDSDAGRARAAVAAAAAARRDARVEGKTGFWIRVSGLWGFGRSGGTGKIPETGVRVWDLELNDEAEF